MRTKYIINKHETVFNEIEKELKNKEEFYEDLLAEYDARFDLMTKEKQIHDLKKENKRLREEFKKFNDYISLLLSSKKTDLSKKSNTSHIPSFSALPPNSFENLQKNLEQTEQEFNQIKARIEQISDPNYVPQLKEKLLVLDQRIKKIDKNRKILEKEQISLGKKLSENQTEYEIVSEINEFSTNIEITDKKLIEINQNIDKDAKILLDKNLKIAEQKLNLRKITDDANLLKIPLNSNENSDSILSELIEKKNFLAKSIFSIKSKYSVDFNDYKQKIIKKQNEIQKIAQKLLKKNQENILKSAEILKFEHNKKSYQNCANLLVPLSRENLAKFNKEKFDICPGEPDEIQESGIENDDYFDVFLL